MSKLTIPGTPLPHMPWEERPIGCKDTLWRYSGNPVIPRDLLPDSNSIFNSAVVPFGDGFAGVFRVDDKNRRMTLHVGFSRDGLHWELEPEPLRFECDIPEVAEWVYGYDPRVVCIGDRYYVTWCNGYHGPTIGVAWTEDFQHFHQVENAFLPYNRNGVLFPRKIGGRFAMLSRPSDTGHTAFGDIFYSESSDLEIGILYGRKRKLQVLGREASVDTFCLITGALGSTNGSSVCSVCDFGSIYHDTCVEGNEYDSTGNAVRDLDGDLVAGNGDTVNVDILGVNGKDKVISRIRKHIVDTGISYMELGRSFLEGISEFHRVVELEGNLTVVIETGVICFLGVHGRSDLVGRLDREG